MLLWLRNNAHAITLLLAFGLGALVNGWMRDSEQLAEERGAQAVKRQVALDMKGIAQAFNKDMEAIKKASQEKGKDIERIIERPVYSNTCFDDDGLRAINALRPH